MAVLDGSLELHAEKQFLFPHMLDDISADELMKRWSAGFGCIIDLINETEKQTVVVPTGEHLTNFYVIKKSFKLHTKAQCHGLDQLIAYERGRSAEARIKPKSIEEMVAIFRTLDMDKVAEAGLPKPVRTSEEKMKDGMEACDAYSHIADTRTMIFHKKDSLCLKQIPAEFWRGLGKNPAKKNFLPCIICYGELESIVKPASEKSSLRTPVKPPYHIYSSSDDITIIEDTDKRLIGETEKRLIDGNYSLTKGIIARCHNQTHRGYLTKNLVKKHQCVEKECSFFEKQKPEYWKALERSEQEKKQKRQKIKEESRVIQERHRLVRDTLEKSGCIHVTSIQEHEDFIFISYIYDRKTDLFPEIRFLRSKLGKTIKMQASIGSDEVLEKLIRKPRRETRKVTDVCKAPMVGKAVKERLRALGVYCLEDLYGRSGIALYDLDCKLSGKPVNRRYLAAYRSAVMYANEINVDNYCSG